MADAEPKKPKQKPIKLDVVRSQTWKTTDGKEHKSRPVAKRAQARIDLLNAIDISEEDATPEQVAADKELVKRVLDSLTYPPKNEQMLRLLREAGRALPEDESEEEDEAQP